MRAMEMIDDFGYCDPSYKDLDDKNLEDRREYRSAAGPRDSHPERRGGNRGPARQHYTAGRGNRNIPRSPHSPRRSHGGIRARGPR